MLFRSREDEQHEDEQCPIFCPLRDVVVIIITFIINTVVHFVGEDTIASWILNKPVIGPLITSLIGLIPNCAASVIITNMYLENVISLGSMISGLLTGAGVGLAVLFKTNNKIKENIGIIVLLYAIGAISGIIIDLIGIALDRKSVV